MAYQTTVIPIMIASPGDVSEERAVVRTTIHEWNDINSVSSKVMLAPVGWDSHASPELGARPQELINKRILADCDLLIGVFWTRVGTHTGVAASGTVEEIQEHVAAGKPAMIYFSSRPVSPDTLDPGQYTQLRQFKEWCKNQGLIQEFSNSDEFRSLIWKHLSIVLNKNSHLQKLLERQLAKPLLQSVMKEAEEALVPISPEGLELIRAAGAADGFIHKITFFSGRFIQAGSRHFGEESGREFARWEAALSGLESAGLLVARGYKGELFEMTLSAWNIVDLLEEQRRVREGVK